LLDILTDIINVVYIFQSFAIAFLRIGHPKLISRFKQKMIKTDMVVND